MFERGLSARTIEYANAVLESAFRQAVRWRMLAEDPCAGVDLPRVKHKEMDALSVEERRRFLAVTAESEWHALFALALTTGMRPPATTESTSRSREITGESKCGSQRQVCSRPPRCAHIPRIFW